MSCKQKWKITIKNAIQLFWKNKWTTEKESKSTMQFLDIQQQPFRNPHQIWKLVPNNTLDIKKEAEIKAKLLTRTYTLQSDRAKFGVITNDICMLCKSNKEDTEHFLLICPFLEKVREKHLSILFTYITNNFGSNVINRINQDGLLVQLILDSSATELRHIFNSNIKIV